MPSAVFSSVLTFFSAEFSSVLGGPWYKHVGNLDKDRPVLWYKHVGISVKDRLVLWYTQVRNIAVLAMVQPLHPRFKLHQGIHETVTWYHQPLLLSGLR